MRSIFRLRQYVYFEWKRWSGFVSSALSLWYIRIYLGVLVALNLALWLGIYIMVRGVYADSAEASLITLNYNVDTGINLIGRPEQGYAIPIIGTIIIMINFAVVLNTFNRPQGGKFIAHVLLTAAVMAQIFLAAGIASLYLVNFR